MRITIAQGPYYPVPALLGTGLEKSWQSLGIEFARRGHEVVHVSRRYPGLAPEERKEGVEHRRVPSRDAPRSKLLYRAYDLPYSLRARRRLPRGADVLVTHCMWLPVLIRNHRRGKLYVHVARFPKGQMRLYRHAARIQAISSPVADRIRRELGASSPQVRVVPLFVSNGLPEGSAPQFGLRPREILYVGRLHPEKGVHVLIEAFLRSGLGDWRLNLVGSHETRHGGGGAAYGEELRSAAARGAGRIRLAGLVADTEALNQWYDRASLLVYPSLAESGEAFGLVPLEAMIRGCPAIVSDLACFRDYIRPGQNGHAFDHRTADPAARLAGLLQQCLSDEGSRVKIARAGYETALAYRLESIAQRYLDDFASL